MSLLRDIQAAAVDPETDVATLLRNCKILAVRLGNENFKKWVDHELNGYDSTEDLPEYRIHPNGSFGDFYDEFGSGLKSAPIPPSCLPEEFRDRVTMLYLKSPIIAYASLINTENRTNAAEHWPADMVAHFGQNIYQGMNCVSAWKVIPYSRLVALVDTIRTRVLNFALEIEGEAPDAGEAPPNAPPLPQEKVTKVFNTIITGDVQNVAMGNSHVTQSGDTIIIPGNFESVRQYLTSLGVDALDIAELDNVIQEDTKTLGEHALGKSVQAWIGKMVGKAESGAWKVSTSVAGTVLGKALSKYFGLE